MSGPTPPKQGGAKALIGTTISDRYLIERLLGEGGMGAVYQAEHTLMRKRMAIKVLHPEMTRLPEVVARFEREAMAAAHIDHPHVVTATDFGKLEDGSFFLALEFVEGASLREVIAKGPLELGRSLHIARQMAAALQRAHGLKIVHRDLKPENVMLVERDGDTDFVKVLDFGIAKVQMGELGTNVPSSTREPRPEQNVLTQAGMVYGTPEYMAPEQALGQPVDARADLYALGVIMFEMLTGHRPFEAESKVALLGMQVTAPVPAMSAKCADCNVPPDVEALVGHLLAKEASERIGDAREVIESIGAILTQLSNAGRIDPRYAPPPVSGFATNPGIISGITPAPEGLYRPPSAPSVRPPPVGSEPPKSEKLLGGRAWLVATGAGVVGLIVLVVAVAYVFRSHVDPNTQTDAGETPTTIDASAAVISGDAPSADQQIKDAIAQIARHDYGSGAKKLEDLGAAANREDAHRALFDAYGNLDRRDDQMKQAEIILATPKLVIMNETDLRVGVRNTALLEGHTKTPADKSAVGRAFSLLQTSLDTVGWDDLYEIAYGQLSLTYKEAATRATPLLFPRAMRPRMSASLQATMQLRSDADSCLKLQNDLPRALADGDIRTLAFLNEILLPGMHLKNAKGRKEEQCLREGEIKATAAKLEAKLPKQK